MRLLSPSDRSRCVPFAISDGEGSEGAMLGGNPPEGIAPDSHPDSLRYFATVRVAIDPPLFASIFVADLEPLMQVRGQVNGPGLVSIVVHPRKRRGSPTPLRSLLSEHSLLLAEPADDEINEDDGAPTTRTGHKIGGAPHLLRPNAALLDAIETLRQDRYALVAQFDFPHGADAVVAGDWPFADGMFALFGREPFQETDWRWWWNF